MRDQIKAFADWLECVEPIKAFVVGLFIIVFTAGATYKGIDSRIEANASDIKTEAALRISGSAAIGSRIDRGFDKVLNRMDGIQHTLDDKAKADADTAHEMGLLRGLYERNYGDIPAKERR